MPRLCPDWGIAARQPHSRESNKRMLFSLSKCHTSIQYSINYKWVTFWNKFSSKPGFYCFLWNITQSKLTSSDIIYYQTLRDRNSIAKRLGYVAMQKWVSQWGISCKNQYLMRQTLSCNSAYSLTSLYLQSHWNVLHFDSVHTFKSIVVVH